MSHLRSLVFAVASLTSAAACSKGAEPAAAADPAADFLTKSATEDLGRAKAALAAKKPGDARYPCAAAMAAIEQLKAAPVAKEIKQVCGHDAPLALLSIATAAAETARAAKPKEEVLTECFNADVAMAKDDLTAAGAVDDGAKALFARYAKACPQG
jgi:hypothetical protein